VLQKSTGSALGSLGAVTDPVLAFIDAAAADPSTNLHTLVIRDAGGVQVEAYWQPYRPADRQLVYSVSKTFTATAAAFAIDEGLLHLEDRVVDLLEPPYPVDGRRLEMTLHHLLSMSTGHDAGMVEFVAGPQGDVLEEFWHTDPQTPVGSRHIYNNGASWAVGEIVRRVTGQTLTDYLRPRVLDPLGIDIAWERDVFGGELGWSGVHITTSDLAAFGQLYASGGRWQGKQVLPVGWTELASTAHIPTHDREDATAEWLKGYGYQVWMSREGFRMDGAHGQYALILSDRETVIAITSAEPVTSQPLLDLVWEHLVPGLGAPASPERAGRLAELSLPTPRDSGSYGSWQHAGPVPVRPSLGLGAEQHTAPHISDVSVTRDASGFTVDLHVDGEPATLTTQGPWRRQLLRTGGIDVPVALAAAVSSRGGVRLRLCATDTVHVLLLDIDAKGAGLAWQTTPLHPGRFADLAAP
jgi:CubicO group peptidase (beta-lactamase class C family)